MKEFAPVGSEFFPVIIDPFFRRGQNNFYELFPLKVHLFHLTLKMQRKPASENVFCLCRPLIFKPIFCIKANSVDPDQNALGGTI